ncbi:CvpA family protein [Stigmatella aurantiaca]|uniref:CvpA family protein n=1 Tax=Stigmatella aurantiaca (strain DW4/3-1) TaxID=378806 RepID=Q08PE6_STIAD|nr:CvpA family protein [Stigmatella aurantiaca]ADO71290.1 CvpA family protein [Stigmatella aurantiaca DW4/3-1]EAU62360.1 CvpA family protein, putative [Stigmatella aurantiaca DW4/3-1]
MIIDLIILGLALFFAVVGAITGAARQVAHLVGLVAAYFVSKRLGPVLAPKLAEALGTPQLAGLLVGSLLIFILVLVVVRYALGALLQRMMSGQDPENRGPDRFIGFLIGGGKVAIIAYVLLSGLTFVEQHVVVAGQRMGLSAKDSKALSFAREHNLFEITQFAALKDFVQVAQLSTDPQRASRLQNDPAYKALRQDPRFQKALKDESLRRSLEQGDHRALLNNNLILQLIQDPDIAARLGAVSRAADRRP